MNAGIDFRFSRFHQDKQMAAEKRLTDNFCCAKCRNKAAVVRSVHLGGNILTLLAGNGANGKYYLVTCGLCGYTEVYDAHVYALQMESTPNEAPVPQKP